MTTVEISTAVRVPPAEAHAFVRDVRGYARYTDHLASVRQHGDGGPGTEYDLTFQWWRLSHTVRCRVTAVEEPREVAWTAVGDVDAHGRWLVEETNAGSRVTLEVTYDAGSARGVLDLPSLASFDRVAERAVGVLESEGREAVARAVADLEGERRPVELTVKTR